jgi:hypothetical protein
MKHWAPYSVNVPLEEISPLLISVGHFIMQKGITQLLAIVWSCKQFRQYLLGRKFTIVNDHKPLTWVSNVKDVSSRRLKLEEFDYDINYKQGVKNKNADALSRTNMTEVSPVKEVDSTLTKEGREKVFTGIPSIA